MDILQREAFAPRAHETFELSLGESSLTLTLTELKALPTPPAPGLTRQPFALTFRSASAIVLPQRLYRLVNATMGPLDVFLVPVGRDPQGVIYQAVFN